jgi:hypothetical protein
LCVVCRERIESIIDGHICAACGGAVHNWCARPADLHSPWNACRVCGGDKAAAAAREKKEQERRYQQRQEERREEATALVDTLVRPLVWWRLLRLALGGLLCILLGFWLIFSPTFRANPNKLTLEDALPGIGAIVVGIVLLGLLFFVWRRR